MAERQKDPKAEQKPEVSNPAPPPESSKPKSDAIPDDIEKAVTWGTVGATILGGLVAFLNNERGPETVIRGLREGAGWAKEGCETLADDTGKAGEMMDAIHPHTERFAEQQSLAREREGELRRQQTTGAGFLFRLFNPLPLAATTRSDGNPRPAIRVNRRGRWPWSR